MFIPPLEMRSPKLVSFQLQFFELRYSHRESLVDLSKPRLQSALWCDGELLQEIASVRVSSILEASGLSNELGNDVEISDLSQDFGDDPEILVSRYLLQEGLRQSAVVFFVG
jgi:hypothetical protein